MSGRATMPKARTGVATSFAVSSGRASANVLGTISPRIIENTVATAIAAVAATDRASPSPRPSAVSGPRRRAPTEGLAR